MTRALLELAAVLASFAAGYAAHAYDQRAVWQAIHRRRDRQLGEAEIRGYRAGVHDRTPPPVPATSDHEEIV